MKLLNSLWVGMMVCLLGSAVAVAATVDDFKGQKGTLNIAGGTAHIPVMKAAAQSIMKVNPEIRITVTGGGSGVGVQQVGEGLVDIGNTGRALKPSEVEKYGLQSFPFAIDGVAVVVNTKNTVNGLSKDQLKGIFTGKITNWQEVGGVDAPITVYVREDGSGTRETFEERALDKEIPGGKSNVANSNGAMKTMVAQDSNAIGYVSMGHLDDKLKGVIIDGMIPSQENAQNGSYTVTRLLYMNTKGKPAGLVALFIDYLFSDDGKQFISQAGYIPMQEQ